MDGKPQDRDVLTLDESGATDQAANEAAEVTPRMLGRPAWVTETDAAPAAEAAGASATVAAPAASAASGVTPTSALSNEQLDDLTAEIIGALKGVYDPEIPADIYELGLIYKIDVDDSRFVRIDMTLTAPGCPVAGEMPIWVEDAVSAVPGVSGCKVTITFDPPWTQDRMSDEARLAINMF